VADWLPRGCDEKKRAGSSPDRKLRDGLKKKVEDGEALAQAIYARRRWQGKGHGRGWRKDGEDSGDSGGDSQDSWRTEHTMRTTGAGSDSDEKRDDECRICFNVD